MGNYTVYVNPYLVLRSGGYTKHYYIEGQRIVSKLGGGWDSKSAAKAGGNKVDYVGKSQKVFDGIVKNLKFLGADGQILTAGKSGKIPPGQISGGTGGNVTEAFKYFYHPDHLGSTSYVTDASGEVYQHLEYMAFGETFVEEHSNTDRTPYLFNGKELDEETGLYYYGARYYDARMSVWQSVDPKMDKYPGLSPYSYVFNSPVNYIDPDGRDGILIVFPDYKIEAFGNKLSNLGHAGVLLIDNKTGYTKYYEFGRYESDQGQVRNIKVPNVKIGKDGKPTVESLNKVLSKISKASGKGGRIEGAYVKSDNFDAMKDYAEGKLKQNNDSERESYSITGNNCGTFACDVLNQDKSVDVDKEAPLIGDPRPVSIIDEYRGIFDKVDYDPKKGTTLTPTKSYIQKAKEWLQDAFKKQE